MLFLDAIDLCFLIGIVFHGNFNYEPDACACVFVGATIVSTC